MSALGIGMIVSALCLLGLGIMIGMALSAPIGWQDDDGFHEGDEHARDDNLGI